MNAPSRYPGYDVLAKREGVSWNEATRRTMDRRLAMRQREPEFFNPAEWAVLCAVCDRIIPQHGPDPVPLAELLDARITLGRSDGYRRGKLPEFAEAWALGLEALAAEARSRHGCGFEALPVEAQDELLRLMQRGELTNPAWQGMPSRDFFMHRLALDIAALYYAHPRAWNEIGFGGPASPRGYVRLGFDRRDPWEAYEAKPGHEREAQRANSRVR